LLIVVLLLITLFFVYIIFQNKDKFIVFKESLPAAEINSKPEVDSEFLSPELLNIFYANATEGLLITDANDIIISVNPAFTKITGYDKDEVIGKSPHLLDSGKHDKSFYDELLSELALHSKAKRNIINRRKNGSLYHSKIYVSVVRDASGEITHYLTIFSDTEEEFQQELLLRKRAETDSLTGLPNRNLFNDRLGQSLVSSLRKGTVGALMFLDLDHFKSLNDTLGHHIGDLLLLEVAKRMTSSIREGDTVSRLGGDEFTIITPEISRLEDAGKIARNIIQKITEPYDLSGHEINITCSLGVAVFPNDASTFDEIVKCADAAMYSAKQSGRNKYMFYSKDISESDNERHIIEAGLNKALQRNELFLEYLPRFSVNGDSHYVDVQTRWEHPMLGVIMPSSFIPLAEENNLIIKMTNWLFSELIKVSDKNDSIVFCVKISSIHFKQANFVEMMSDVADLGLNPNCIQLKIDETVIAKNTVEAIEKTNALKELGYSVCIDDFGLGSLSIEMLSLLSFDAVKIPKELTNNESLAESLGAIISLAKSFSAEVTLEGVSKENQVGELNCDYYQGYIYSEALSFQDLSNVMK